MSRFLGKNIIEQNVLQDSVSSYWYSKEHDQNQIEFLRIIKKKENN